MKNISLAINPFPGYLKKAASRIAAISLLTIVVIAASSCPSQAVEDTNAPVVPQNIASQPPDRFVSSQTGTVLDKKTDLMWLSNANIDEAPMPLQLAQQFVLEMNSGGRPNYGYTNWRLPTILELESLLDMSRKNPALPERHPFVNVQNSIYWSSSMGADDIMEYALALNLATGEKSPEYTSYCNFKYFWPVRSTWKTQKTRAGAVSTGGLNNYGQLGDGTTEDRATIMPVADLNDVVSIAAGDGHVLAVKVDGTLWAWGWNSDGQLGDGTTMNIPVPFMVKGIWKAMDAAAGMNHSVVLLTDGTVWAWGRNAFGQLGDGSIIDRNTPVEVREISHVIKIAAGAQHTVALKSDGTVWAWGRNLNGQLGDGEVVNRTAPVQVKNLTKVIDISANQNHTIALKSDGTVWAWGKNSYGLLGDGTREDKHLPVQVRGLSNITAIAAGLDHSIALKADGTLWAWGSNEYGQLGINIPEKKESLAVMVEDLANVRKIAAGAYHSVAVLSDGTISVWGRNLEKVLEKTRPYGIKYIKDAFDAAAGRYFTIILSGGDAKKR